MRSTCIRWLACAGLALLAACEHPTESAEEYALVQVNDRALPAPFPDPMLPEGAFQVSAGTLTLRPDGKLSGSWTMRCPSPLPQGTTCQIEGDGRQRFEGTWSRAEQHVVIAERQYPAVFGEDHIEITIQLPSYTGYWPSYRLRYRR